MILGNVTDELEPRIQLLVSSFEGREVRSSAVIDTGFAGYLTVPPQLFRKLRLPIIGPTTAVLADGSKVELDEHLALVIWNGRKRSVVVLAADEDPLVGTQMLEGHSLRIDMSRGGNVVIRPSRKR